MKERISNIPAERSNKPIGEPIEVEAMSDADIRKLCRTELVLALKANSGKPVVAQLVNALLDRIDGKPAQTVNQTVDIAATITRIECVIVDPILIEQRKELQ